MSEFTLADIEPGQYEDIMPDMDDEEFAALKESIDTDGLRHPIEVTPEGVIVDGHHRYRACQELGVGPDVEVLEDATPEWAIRANFTRRNLNDGTKREVVEKYLEQHYGGDQTQREVADSLGVSLGTVNKAWKNVQVEQFTTEERDQQIADYLDRNPDASNREVARNVEADVSHVTVGNKREEWESPPKDDVGAEPEPPTDDDPEPPTDAADESDPEAAPETDTADTPDTVGASEADPTAADVDTTTPDGAADAGMSEPTSTAIGYVDDLEADLEARRDERDRLRDVADRRKARVDELEGMLRDVIKAVENQDAEAIQTAASRAEELL